MSTKCKKCKFKTVKPVVERDKKEIDIVKRSFDFCSNCGNESNVHTVNKRSEPPEV